MESICCVELGENECKSLLRGFIMATSHSRLLTHVGPFPKHSLIFSEVFCNMERSKNLEKNFITVQKNSSSREGLTVETRFLDIEKSNSKRLLLNDSKCNSVPRG